MLPSMLQRLRIAIAIAIGLAGWWWAGRFLAMYWGGLGLSLVDGQSGWLLGSLIMLAMGLPALAGSIWVSNGKNYLAGVFSSSFALGIVAMAGGPIDNWLRHITSPKSYGGLALEMLLWELGLVIWLIAIFGLSGQVERWLHPARPITSSPVAVPSSSPVFTRLTHLAPSPQAMLAGLATAVVGAVVSIVLIRSSQAGQVSAGLLVGFAVGGLTGQMILKGRHAPSNLLLMLLAPGVVAIVAYLVTGWGYGSHDQLLSAWFAQTRTDAGLTNRLLSLAQALPVFYISAGVAGVSLGIGLAQVLQADSIEQKRLAKQAINQIS